MHLPRTSVISTLKSHVASVVLILYGIGCWLLGMPLAYPVNLEIELAILKVVDYSIKSEAGLEILFIR